MKFDKNNLLLYAVTDRSWLAGEELSVPVEQALMGGITMLQFREKKLTGEALIREARALQKLCRAYGVPFVINDNVELAARLDADGVHVGQQDMQARQARSILGSEKIIGVSAHSVEEALRAEADGADYLGAGAVFGTGTKSDAGTLDHAVLREICSAVKIPVVAIGGIGCSNIGELKGTGISGVAVVSAIFGARDIKSSVTRLRALAKETAGGMEVLS